ncbi:type VI secretion system Vgr family protein [Trinickia fusca]|uniref:Type VI secretion system tip protein VgrG n=1 Tax=Trinickia fusca TaxID=2419777 RepID=A0A494X8X4_9BURK|nr:type VI secretion system tip protein VgrG [Trinickia fusca]
MARIFTLESPLGDELKFHRLSGWEALGAPFEYRIDALASSHSLSLRELLGKPVTVTVQMQDGGTRYLNGIVARASLNGRRAERHYGYELVVRPWLWLATRRADCRIFQNKTVPDIVQEVLARYGFPIENRLSETYAPREYCVQYNESDATFVARLMEFEGIYYYFKHAAESHTLVLCDGMASHVVLPGYETIPYFGQDRTAIADEEHIDSWLPAQEVSVGTHQASDYDYIKPRADLSAQRVDPRGHDHDGYATFEWPGGYRDDGLGEHYTRVRLEELQAEHERAEAHTDVRGMATGYLFTLERCPRADQNRQYLIVRSQYRFQENVYASEHEGEGVLHETNVLVQPTTLPFRPPRVTPRPRTHGPQSALVVGPPGEEIWTDRYGRIKLQFLWDRYGQRDQNSSCWVRVSSPWAGGGFGGVQIPRVGDEVIVDFMNGDPDYPIVTGRVYNGESMPPWDLPASATQSGLLSRSSPGGAASHANAMRFEDAKGLEQLWMHAERNLDMEAEVDHSISVGRDRSHSVGRNETMQVGNDRQKSIGNNETVNVTQHRTAQVGANDTTSIGGNHSVTVKGDSTHTVTAGNHRVVVAAGTQEFVVKGDSTHLVEAGSHKINVASGDYALNAAKSVLVQATGQDLGLVSMGGAVQVYSQKQGVFIQGDTKGVGIVGNTTGVGIEGTGQGVQISGKGDPGITAFGDPKLNLGGKSEANLGAPKVNIGGNGGPCEVSITADKIVLSVKGGSITLDSSGVTITGVIAYVN